MIIFFKKRIKSIKKSKWRIATRSRLITLPGKELQSLQKLY